MPGDPQFPLPAQADAVIGRDSTRRLLLVILAAAVLIALLFLRVSGINGTQHFIWFYRHVDPWRVYFPMFLAALPFFVAQWRIARLPEIRFKHVVAAIACMTVSNLAMQLVMVAAPAEPYGLSRIVQIIGDPDATSYFIDAARVEAQVPLRTWLDEYDRILPHLTFHSKEKPPGPVFYHVGWIRLLGPAGAAALFGGMAIGVLGTFSIPATYWLIVRLSGDVRAALAGAGYLSLSPCLIHFFPMFDQVYPVFACGMLGLWVLSLRDNRPCLAAGFGGVMAVAIFASYCHLVLGAFVAIYSLAFITRHRSAGWRRFIRHSAIGLGTVALIYLLLWIVTGFDPIATFRVAVQNQQELLREHITGRDWPGTILPDLQDFLLGSGWISLLLLIYWLIRRGPDLTSTTTWETRALVWMGIAQIVIVALTGLLQSETSRVWMFLQPLMMLPLGLELSRWGAWQRSTLFFVLWLITCAQGQHLAFIRGHGITQTLIVAAAY